MYMWELEYSSFVLAMISNDNTQPQLWDANRWNVAMVYSDKVILFQM